MQPLFLFKILGIPFFSYSTLVGVGILLALFAAAAASRGSVVDRHGVIGAVAWAACAALAGGRLLHIAYNIGYFAERPGQLLRIEDGGMSLVGLFCGGCAGLWLWCRRHGVPFGAAADQAALPVSVLGALAWLGAFLHGSQYGAPVDNALALELRDTFGVIEARWPTQLLASAWCALLGLGLIARQRARRASGAPYCGASLMFLTGYGTGLFLLDFTRGDASLFVAGLRLTQILYALWGVAAIAIIGRSLTSA
jgi:phosphatidylglycerol:prolipoprotein diacylglycerol transferase